MRFATACHAAVWAGGATSMPNVELRVEALLPGCFAFAVALVVALSGPLALRARAKDNCMMLCWLRKLACHCHVVFLLFEVTRKCVVPVSRFFSK
jgi:hypothetical protein